MKRSMIAVMSVVAVLFIGGMAQAETTTWDVATVHGNNQFSISPDSSLLHYNQQGWTDYVWYNNNGSPPGTIATTTVGPNSPAVDNRSGMRTFATTDVAVGQRLDSLKLQFDYNNTVGLYPTINFFMTDGLGHYGILAPASGGVGALSTSVVNGNWTTITFDLTNPSIPDTATVAVYEHNGLTNQYGDPFTTMTWGGTTGIKQLTIAGMYDYQRSPTDGWGAWGTMFSEINTAGDSTIINGHGLALIWGDTANSNNSYGSAQREIRNVTVSFGGTDYTGTFANATIPEPGTLMLLVTAGLGALAYAWRRCRS